MRNYRVIHRDGEYAVHEVFYGDDGRVVGFTQEPVFPRADSLDHLIAECERYRRAFSEPVLNYTDLESRSAEERRRQGTG